MDDDERFGAALHRAVSTLDAPTGRLVEGAIRRGRRRRRWVRGAEVLTGAAVLAGVATLVVALVGGTSPGRKPNGPVAVGGARTPARPAADLITPQALLQTALGLLPHGTTSRYAGNYSAGDVNAQFLYNDGHGAAQVDVSLDYPPLGGDLGGACQISTCTNRPDGSTLAVYQGNGHPGDTTLPGKDWEVSLRRADGVVVSVTEWNSAQEKGAPQTRPLPPFTITRLTAVVGSSQWQSHVSHERVAAAAHLFRPVHNA
jgi:hypothetical protein